MAASEINHLVVGDPLELAIKLDKFVVSMRMHCVAVDLDNLPAFNKAHGRPAIGLQQPPASNRPCVCLASLQRWLKHTTHAIPRRPESDPPNDLRHCHVALQAAMERNLMTHRLAESLVVLRQKAIAAARHVILKEKQDPEPHIVKLDSHRHG